MESHMSSPECKTFSHFAKATCGMKRVVCPSRVREISLFKLCDLANICDTKKNVSYCMGPKRRSLLSVFPQRFTFHTSTLEN